MTDRMILGSQRPFKPEVSVTELKDCYADMHIHIGSARGRAVKITASRRLQLRSIIKEDAPRKGLDIVGIVDAGSTLVAEELDEMLSGGELVQLRQGGCQAENGVLVILGCEVESREGVHLITYLPDIYSLRAWQDYFRTRISNLQLSTQKAAASIADIMALSRDLGGIFCPAHAFTPHKGIYGAFTERLADIATGTGLTFRALELGLSADTEMAGHMAETADLVFLSNSDAHSSPNVGREYNLLKMGDLSFLELGLCLENQLGRRVGANYGLHPQLGKYHRSCCLQCGTIAMEQPPVLTCGQCGCDRMVVGVHDRIASIQDYHEALQPGHRPPYHYRLPLRDLPGIGARTCQRLTQALGSEIEVAEDVPLDEIARVAGSKAAGAIGKMRSGQWIISPGGGGRYGRIILDN